MTLCELLVAAHGRNSPGDEAVIEMHTGGRYEGTYIFERRTPNFLVTAQAWQDLPVGLNPDETQLRQWLDAIFVHGADVLSVGMVVYMESGMSEVGIHHISDICVVPAGVPVRRWLLQEELGRLMYNARGQIAVLQNAVASFGRKELII